MIKKLLFLSFLLSNIWAQTNNILIDEDFSDWKSIKVLHTDPAFDNNGGKIDFRRLWVTNDKQFIFFNIEVTGQISLANEKNITLYLDTDNNKSTGLQYAGIGAELVFKFGDRKGAFYSGGSSSDVYHNDLNLYPLPTVDAEQFEFAIDRKTKINGKSLFNSSTIKIVIKDLGTGKDMLPDNDGGVSYSFNESNENNLPEISIPKPASKYLRVMSYNIERDGFFETSNSANYNRIFNAVKPEIIGFQEIYDHSAEQTAAKVEELLPSNSGEKWYSSKAGYDIILVSKFKIVKTFEIAPKAGHAGDSQYMGGYLLDLRPKYDSDLLVIDAHPKCCSGDLENEKRQNQCDAIMEFIREAKNDGGELTLKNRTPIIILGDMNFVGDPQQPKTLRTGDIANNTDYGADFRPDWSSPALTDAKPPLPNLPVINTTNNPFSSYPPGRLDYMFFTGSVLDLVNSYVLYTPSLTGQQLSDNNLLKDDTYQLSDHLPVIADFELKGVTDIKDGSTMIDRFELNQNYPNPFNPTTNIKFTVPSNSSKQLVQLSVYDVLGNKIRSLVKKELSSGTYSVKFNAYNLASGIYFYNLSANNFNKTKKMLLLR